MVGIVSAQFSITSSLQSTTSSIVYSTPTSSQQIIPPTFYSVHQHQPGAHQLVQQHDSEQPVHTGAHQVLTTQNPDSIVSAPPGDVNTQTDTSGASILSTDTSVNNNSSNDITQVEIHQEHHDTHDVVDSVAAKQQQNIVINETIIHNSWIRLVLIISPTSISTIRGVTWTDKGYVYNPHLYECKPVKKPK